MDNLVFGIVIAAIVLVSGGIGFALGYKLMVRKANGVITVVHDPNEEGPVLMLGLNESVENFIDKPFVTLHLEHVDM